MSDTDFLKGLHKFPLVNLQGVLTGFEVQLLVVNLCQILYIRGLFQSELEQHLTVLLYEIIF